MITVANAAVLNGNPLQVRRTNVAEQQHHGLLRGSSSKVPKRVDNALNQ
jgi:hypothetical protein